MTATVLSSICTAGSITSAVAEGDRTFTIVVMVVNAIILISNAALDIFKKWRSTIKEKNNLEEEKENVGTGGEETGGTDAGTGA